MSVKIYKPGQGYWTRLLSAIGGGVLVAAGAEWLWRNLSILSNDYARYIQAAAVILMLAVFGFLLAWLIGSKPRTIDFMIATEGEMKKVNWPSRKEVVGSTWVVICCVVLLATLLFSADIVFAWIFQQVGILEINK